MKERESENEVKTVHTQLHKNGAGLQPYTCILASLPGHAPLFVLQAT